MTERTNCEVTKVVAYWLLPSEPQGGFLAAIIRRLAKRFDTPIFAPHITVFVAPKDSHAPGEVLRELGPSDVTLTVTDIRFSDKFTKTLFIQFEQSEPLQQLSDTIGKASGARRSNKLDPHLSLLYKSLPAATKAELAATIELPFREFHFDTICAMRCTSPTKTAAHVRAWRLLVTQNSISRKGG